MARLHASAERTVPVPAAAVYALLADYRDGHPRILPPAFSDLTVLRGGTGAGTVIREHCTINRSIHTGKATVVGARCFLMANAHVGHDCEVADDVVLVNNVMLAGHVSVGSFSFIGGGAGVR